jgi:hypothetical protein
MVSVSPIGLERMKSEDGVTFALIIVSSLHPVLSAYKRISDANAKKRFFNLANFALK